MALLSADLRELFLPLVEGIHESPPWGAFLRNLAARMYARRACLVLTLANAAPDQAPSVIQVAAPRAVQDNPLDFRELDALRLHPYGALRPGRVYALDEMLDYGDRAQLAHQRAALGAMGIRYGRWLRISAGGAADAWLVLVREREDFSGSAVALLDGLAAHMAAALRTLAALIDQRLQTALATSALARLGAGQLAFDAGGRVMAADSLAETLLSFIPEPGERPGRRLNLRPDIAHRLEAVCAMLSGDPQSTSVVMRLDDGRMEEGRGTDILLRRSDLVLAEPCARPAVIGTIRAPVREPARQAIRAIAALHGLSDNEAALAHALSMGETLIEAGRRLRLSEETARNYSKRVYAKTGARGQADLVRLILAGLAPFA